MSIYIYITIVLFIYIIHVNRFINLSEEKTRIESELKQKINLSNSSLIQLQAEFEAIQAKLNEKTTLNKKLLQDYSNLHYIIDAKNKSINELKSQITEYSTTNNQLKQDKANYERAILSLKETKQQNLKEIEYLMQQIKQLNTALQQEQQEITSLEEERLRFTGMNQEIKFENTTRSTSIRQMDSTVSYYEKQLSESNQTIQRMADMIKELETQIEDVQKEIDAQSKLSKKVQRSKYENDTQYNGLIEAIDNKNNDIKHYLEELEVLTEEKNKLFEDNAKMYTDVDNLQNHIYTLMEQNKTLVGKLKVIKEQEAKVEYHFERKNQMHSILNNNQDFIAMTMNKGLKLKNEDN